MNIISLIATVADKIHLQPPAHYFSILIALGMFHNADIHIKTSNQQFVVYNVLHNMVFFLLSEVKLSIAQSHIREVIFEGGSDIFFSLNVISFGFADKKSI